MVIVATLSSSQPIKMLQSHMQRSNIMRVILDDFTNQEFDFLAEMIYEKITDMGYANDGTFAFTLSVEFEENDDES